MADRNIGALPQVPDLNDDSLMVVEQQGQAMKMTGAQFKEFGRQSVIAEVQGYVNTAQAAAASAAGAVSAVTDMTVEAHASDTPTVSKTTRNGKVNLDFGLPRGEQGIPGPDGPAGPRGPRGETGKGLDILGYYDTPAALEAAVPAPDAGDAYGVGAEAPYDIYVFDGVTGAWKNNGPLSGGGGGVIPENVVTAEGGASLEIPDGLGDAPHVIAFTDEEEPPLTAEDIAYGDGSVDEALEQLFTSVSDGKARIASAITDKGVPTAQDASFADLAKHIGQITGGADTSDATATPGDILAGKTAYTASGKVEGIVPTLAGQTIVPGTADKTIANGQYLGGTQVIKGDPNLTSGNIKKGVSIFGVAGAVEQSFLATLTVTADVGAVVTATHTSGASVEALSTTGSVTLELPLEGTWKITAVRGVAQYNTATVEVTSQYSAALTAEVHIVRYGSGTPLSEARNRLGAASVGGYALFAGGQVNGGYLDVVDAYDKNYSRTSATPLNLVSDDVSGVSIAGHALFCFASDGRVEAYDEALKKSTLEKLNTARVRPATAEIEDTALFGGGRKRFSAEWDSGDVDVYDKSLTHSTLTGLVTPVGYLAAAANDNYAVFAGGNSTDASAGTTEYRKQAIAYDKQLTRSIPTSLSVARSQLAAARAGSYILFAGGRTSSGEVKTVEAYDLFLTRVAVEELSVGRSEMAAATLNGFALFGGGGSYSRKVDCYDPYLTKTTPEDLGVGRYALAAATIENSILFAGGRASGSNSANVDIYQYV